MKDPTLQEMRDYLATVLHQGEDFDVEEAIYWYAAYYHSGQTSNLYSALSMSQFIPSPISSGPEEGSMADWLYEDLEHEFGGERYA